jgi:hypothetical protein
VLKWVTGHCNRAAVSRNRYGVEKTVDTHNILINAIKFYVCLQEILCFKSVIQSGRSLFLSKIKNTSLKLPVGVSPLQLVNLHSNRRYFVIKLHTWFCLSYFLKKNITFYCISRCCYRQSCALIHYATATLILSYI